MKIKTKINKLNKLSINLKTKYLELIKDIWLTKTMETIYPNKKHLAILSACKYLDFITNTGIYIVLENGTLCHIEYSALCIEDLELIINQLFYPNIL